MSPTVPGGSLAHDVSMPLADATHPTQPQPPPSRDGIGASCVALPPGPWVSVLDFLTERFPRVDRDEWLGRMLRGDVMDEAGRALDVAAPYRPQRKLYYFRSVPDEPRLPVEETLLYRDDFIAVVDKPHGLPVVPSGRHLRETLLVRLRRRLGIDTATPMHRIDRDTAGLVLFSLQASTRAAYHAMFRERRVEKHYEAIAPRLDGMSFPLTRSSRLVEAEDAFMQMREVPGEPNAVTRIDVLEVCGERARYDLRPLTGQRHQLRVHLAALGAPIVNDRIYPILQPDAAGDATALEREHREPLQLLARGLDFLDPVTGAARRFVSERRLMF